MRQNVSDEIRDLRRALRDVIAISTLPAIWTCYNPDDIAQSLADVLLSTLSLDLIYIQVQANTGENIVELACGRHQPAGMGQIQIVGKALAPWLEIDISDSPPSIPNPFGSGTLQIAIARFGHTGDRGVLAAGSQRPDFPNEFDRLLLGVGANHTAIMLQRQRAAETLRQSERRYAMLAELVPQLVWTTGPDGAVDYFNQRWYDYTGTTPEQSIGQGWTKVLHLDDRERTWAAWKEALKAGHPLEVEYRLRGADGEYQWFLARGLPLRDDAGRITKWFGTCTNIDAHKKAQQALEEADKRKNEFLAILAHELHSPLTPIRFAVEILQTEGLSEPDLQLARDVIDRQAQQMTRLVEDLLDVSRITVGRIELRKKRVELAEIVRRALEASRPVIEASGHKLTVTLPQEPVYLDADLTRLAQVFWNLLNNAAKYTERGGSIWLAAERQANVIVVQVQDTGIGIPADILPKIFDAFVQVDTSLERSQGGLGIGLTLVKRLVELHDGSVEVQSDGPGKGSTFIVRLPSA